MMKYKSFSLFMCAALLACAVTACGDAAEQTPKTTDGTPSGTQAVTEPVAEEPYPDKLPDTDLDGYDFRIYAVEQERDIDTVYASAETGNIVNDAIYRKLRNVEERFNCHVKLISDGAVYSDAILAGDDEYDICCDHDITMAGASLSGQFLNLYDIPHLDFSQPWWPSSSVESLSLGNQMYLFSNHLTACGMHETRVLYFNKTLFESLDIAFPYQAVYDHKWTLDSMYEISRLGYADLNGNGQQDAEDRYGIVNCSAYYAMLEPFNMEPYSDVNGTLEWDFNIERWQPLVEKLHKILCGEGAYICKDYDERISYFADGHVLFAYGETSCAISHLSGSDVRYGVVPMPLLDESQEKYYSGRTDRPYGVPTTADSHKDTTGLLIEALSAEGYREVYPAYFEVTMKSRYSDQSDDANMFDIIMDNSILSFTYMYGTESPYNSMLKKLFAKDSTDVASYAAQIEGAQTKRVNQINEAFEMLRNNG